MKYEITEDKYLNREELEHLNKIIKDDFSRNALIIKIALATGARAQEILNLTTQDLSDKTRTVLIRGLKNSKDRKIPLTKSLYNELKQYTTTLQTEKLFDISYSRLHVIWDHYKPGPKSFHSLRHTFAIELYKRTQDVLLIKAALGHRSLLNSMVYMEHIYETENLKRILK